MLELAERLQTKSVAKCLLTLLRQKFAKLFPNSCYCESSLIYTSVFFLIFNIKLTNVQENLCSGTCTISRDVNAELNLLVFMRTSLCFH